MSGEEHRPCDDTSSDEGRHCLNERDRERVISRIHSALFWVGELIPDSYQINGKMVPLRDTIFKIITDEDVTDEDTDNARKLATLLETDARRLEKDLKNDRDISKRDAHLLLDEVLGLLRAVDDLKGLNKEEMEIKKEALKKRLDDEERWLNFVKEFNH